MTVINGFKGTYFGEVSELNKADGLGVFVYQYTGRILVTKFENGMISEAEFLHVIGITVPNASEL